MGASGAQPFLREAANRAKLSVENLRSMQVLPTADGLASSNRSSKASSS